jgi:hypothetical protein
MTGTALTAPWPTDLKVVFGKADGAEAIMAGEIPHVQVVM